MKFQFWFHHILNILNEQNICSNNQTLPIPGTMCLQRCIGNGVRFDIKDHIQKKKMAVMWSDFYFNQISKFDPKRFM